jgi:integrase
LDEYLIKAFGSWLLSSITSDDVRAWHTKMGKGTPTARSHAYGLLRTIMGTATSDGKISLNPCVIRAAGSTKRVHKIRPATLQELEAITNAMPVQYQAMILLASWCALRFGELTELRRKDIELTDYTETVDEGNDVEVQEGVIRIRRAVVRVGDGFQVTTPKSDAGTRDVAMPPNLVPMIKAHLEAHVGPEPGALLFPAKHGGHLAPATLYRRFYTARTAAKRPDLRFHDLRHSGAVLAAMTGATLAELIGRRRATGGVQCDNGGRAGRQDHAGDGVRCEGAEPVRRRGCRAGIRAQPGGAGSAGQHAAERAAGEKTCDTRVFVSPPIGQDEQRGRRRRGCGQPTSVYSVVHVKDSLDIIAHLSEGVRATVLVCR